MIHLDRKLWGDSMCDQKPLLIFYPRTKIRMPKKRFVCIFGVLGEHINAK